MKAYKYEIIVGNGIHSYLNRTISEIFIPELNLYVNKESQFLPSNHFPNDYRMKRGKNKIEIKIDDKAKPILEMLVAYLENKEKIFDFN